jgi:hypothetical protein
MDHLFSFLYARPSFIEGLARIFDLGNTLCEYNQSLTPQQADYLALRSDWLAIAGDLRNAMQEADVPARHKQDARALTHA